MSDEIKRNITDLPPELLAKIFKFLHPVKVSQLSKLCKAFRNASFIDSIWQKKCLELGIHGFGIHLNDGYSFRQVYTKLLHKYKRILGVWQKNVTDYGGLLFVTFDSRDGKIIGTEWDPPNYPNIMNPVRKNLVFSIEFDTEKDGPVQPRCKITIGPPTLGKPNVLDSNSHHSCEIIFGKTGNNQQTSGFRTICSSSSYHELGGGILQEVVPNPSPDYRMMKLRKFAQLCQYNEAFEYNRLVWPSPIVGARIQPGLFKGDYGSHGVELILLTYTNDTRVIGTKITGDPNVPAGQVTFEANLLHALVLNSDQQNNLNELKTIQEYSSLPVSQLPLQPFEIPTGVSHGHHVIPKFCVARFRGLGQVASIGYRSSAYIDGHWIVFDENLFGFIWFDISSFILFHRAQ